MSTDHLKAGQLGTLDVTASTVANIGPGIDFYFAFGVIAVTAGVAAPLTILAGAVAVALLAFVVAEFTKAEPSAGSFITYVETSLGARAGVATAVLVAVGFTVAIAGVFTIPRALYVSIAIATALFVLFAYATVTGFGYDVSSIGRSSVPFLSIADRYLGTLAPLAWVAGIVSVLATLVAGVNSQARMLFDGGRSGLLPARLGHLRQPQETPMNALLVMACGGLGIIVVWWAVHLVGTDHGSTDPVGLYAECSTMGTIVILFVYLLTTLALPLFVWRRHRQSFSALRHLGGTSETR